MSNKIIGFEVFQQNSILNSSPLSTINLYHLDLSTSSCTLDILHITQTNDHSHLLQKHSSACTKQVWLQKSKSVKTQHLFMVQIKHMFCTQD